MGNYNPHVPQILGQEWVGIRDEDLELNPLANSFERGHGFTLASPTQVSNARFYINTFPPQFVRNQIYTASIYPRGAEAESGPVRSVIIPCNNGTITGDGVVTNGFSVPASVYNSSANAFIFWPIGRGFTPGKCSFFFAVDSYAQLLAGKRILGVNVLTNIDVQAGSADNSDFSAQNGQLEIGISNDALNQQVLGSQSITRLPPLVTALTPAGTIKFIRIQMGDANLQYGMTGDFSTDQTNISQWTYPELQRFEASNSNRIMILLNDFANSAYLGAELFISYMALEVFFCEERRAAFGSKLVMGQDRNPYVFGTNQFLVRAPNGTANPVLAAGDYTLTLSESNTGDDFLVAFNIGGGVPILNELRQLYEIPSHPGVQINLPYPLNDEAIGTTFTKESTDLLPQISLHASGGVPLVEPHVYGSLTAGQVYGVNTVTQTINDGVIGASTQWPWVRYYARRFGNTTSPLRLETISPAVSGSGVVVQITPGEFDELDSILDGWKEVTLRFPTPPVMGTGSTPTWKWSAANETIGSRWEVLGSAAYAASGRAFMADTNTQFGQAPITERLYISTYGQPVSGASIYEAWLPQMGPYVSGTTPDPSADAVLIFGPDMPTVTGFSISGQSQAISGIGQDCGLDPCGIPTGIDYNYLSWSPNAVTVLDNFDRVNSPGWGTPAGYQYSWSSDANASVNGSDGLVSLAASTATSNMQLTGMISSNQEVFHAFTIPAITINPGQATSGNFASRVYTMLRYLGSSANYQLMSTFSADGTGFLTLSRNGVVVSTVTQVPAMNFIVSDGEAWNIRFRAQINQVRVRIWKQSDPEPDVWQLSYFDTSPLAAGSIAVAYETPSTTVATGFPFIYTVSRVSVDTVASLNKITYELQRSDEITDWQTIMLSDDPFLISFNDYEARVGLLTSYRIRRLSTYEFAGPWSSTISTTSTPPGLSGSCLDDGAHVLIFTTNERQDGSSNLAYSTAWEGMVNEGFGFAEAGFTQLQAMYGRDFFTAFRPRERGGDQFSRELLVQAAAIAPETLADFVSLRDMAWDSVSYICVRDEDGNRWFAVVDVPSGLVQNRRRLYRATVQISEVTDTPSQVSP